jgi:hypothetical protein
MALTNAERQRRFRERRNTQRPVVHYRRPRDRRSRPQRWEDAVETLRELQEEYREWLENMPWSLRDSPSPVVEKLTAICDLDLEQLDVELPRGFGRDDE